MIHSKKDLKECLSYEYKKYFKNKKRIIVWVLSKLKLGEKYIIWDFQKKLRKLEYHINLKHKIRHIIYKLKVSRLSNKYGLHISPNCFEKGLRIMHLGYIYVNEKAKIGQDCSIHVNTYIVAGGYTNDAPTLGNRIIIGVWSIIIGGIRIGDNCAIGAGAVITKSFGENVTIAGVPAKVISNNNSDSWRNIN